VTPRLRLAVLPGRWAVCRLDPTAEIPAWAIRPQASFASVTRTRDGLSIICDEESVPAATMRAERGFRALRVVGALDFDAVGVLSTLTAPLAAADVPVLAHSTYDTDYLLVREPDLERALAALRATCDVEPVSPSARAAGPTGDRPPYRRPR
jgi:hypothetical protein